MLEGESFVSDQPFASLRATYLDRLLPRSPLLRLRINDKRKMVGEKSARRAEIRSRDGLSSEAACSVALLVVSSWWEVIIKEQHPAKIATNHNIPAVVCAQRNRVI